MIASLHHRTRPTGQRGSGLLGTLFGVAVVMVLIGFAANVALGLWVRSTVDAVAYDAARRVAATPADDDPRERAEAAVEVARHELGPTGRRVQLTFESLGPPAVVLHVRSPGVTLLPRLIAGGPVVGELDRRIVVRREVDEP